MRAPWRVEARDDPAALGVERRKRLPKPHIDLVLERGQQSLDQRGRPALDAEDFIALAEHLKRLAQIGADEVHHIEAGLILRLQPEFDVVGDIEQIDRPVVGLAAELLQIGLQAHLVELGGVLRPIFILVGQLVGVLGDLLGDRRKGARLLSGSSMSFGVWNTPLKK